MNLLTPAAVLATFALGAVTACHRQPSPSQQQARAVALTRPIQQRLAARSAAIAHHEAAAEAAVATTAGEAAHAVEIAAGAHAPVPPDVLARWGDAVDRLRDNAAKARANGSAGADPATAARGLSASEPPPGA